MSGATRAANFTFEPRVWSDHSKAYFDRKLVYGMFAVRNDTLKEDAGKGDTVNFPFYKSIDRAEEIEEDESLSVDNLTDDSFSATVFEAGKAVGIKKRAFKRSADKVAGIVSEAQEQIGRVMAELVDEKLNDEITATSSETADPLAAASYINMNVASVATAATDTMNVRTLLRAKIRAFGDKSDDAQICFMHSLQWLDSQIDATAGFLRADANDPLSAIKGFTGRFFGMAIIIVDSVKKVGVVGGKDAYLSHFHKMDSYGIIEKQEMEMDEDKDILARERLYTGNQWYGVRSFHRRISPLDNKTGGLITTVSENLVA